MNLYLNVETRRNGCDVDGWYPEKMGISVAVALMQTRVQIFTEKNVTELVLLLKSAKAVIGYNIEGFDFKVLSGYSGLSLEGVRYIDLMRDIAGVTGCRISLGSAAAATLGCVRSSDSLELVKLWKEGNIEKVIEGCCNVALEIKALHEYGRHHGELFYYPEESKRRRKIKVDWKKPLSSKSLPRLKVTSIV